MAARVRRAAVEHRPRPARLPPPAGSRPRPRGALDALLGRAVQLLGRVRRGRADEGLPQGHARGEPRRGDPPGAHRGRVDARRLALRLARPRGRGGPTRPSSSRCCSSSCAPPATAGTWRWPASATSSPRPTCTPTRSVATSPARPPAWASPWPRSTPTWPSTSPSRTGTPTRSTPSPSAMEGRLEAALEVVPGLAEHEAGLRATYARLRDLDRVEVQQVHGDLHLGQTLRTVKGWKIVDFEGEPAKPLAERLKPDSVWRDVAGMIRSFDYAPRVVAMTSGDVRPRREPTSGPTGPRSGRRATARRSSPPTPRSVAPRSTRPPARCSRPTSRTRPSTRPSTKPATARDGCPSRWQRWERRHDRPERHHPHLRPRRARPPPDRRGPPRGAVEGARRAGRPTPAPPSASGPPTRSRSRWPASGPAGTARPTR